MLPWALLLPGLARFLARRSARTAARRPVALGFFLLASLWVVLFYSAAGSKRPVYILPAMPPLALALGCYLDVLLPGPRLAPCWAPLWRRTSRLAYVATVLVLALGLGVVAWAGAARLVKPAAGVALAAGAVAALGVLLWRRRLSWAACAATTFAVLFLGVQHLHPSYNRQFAVRNHLLDHAGRARMARPSVVCHPQRWDSVTFYLPEADVRVYGGGQRRELVEDLRARPDSLLLVKTGPALDGLLRGLPPGLEFVPRGRPGAFTAGWVRPRRPAVEPVARR
jgi:dolichol-phosphate mannosyltransferase